ncbi:MAG: hypothetical protein N4A57_03280 [Anaeromicrobium sp.]|jgi:hypothetical protein|uniref:hypothetical protein n=1 Tax=Anaeromicrobium sp. TaxID=1929132 RepID=UPI0025DD7CA0|nr:hypothetical protein [Anaeromicrobium sp.]MCT4593282.1 hypothetical protein [Anaeromicrobium sp.]
MKKIIVLISCIMISLLIMSSGFGSWQEELDMEGTIKVKKPDPPKTQMETPASQETTTN